MGKAEETKREISRIPDTDRQKNPASRAQIEDIFRFPESRNVFWPENILSGVGTKGPGKKRQGTIVKNAWQF